MRFLVFLLPLFLMAIPPLDKVLNYPKSYYRDFWLIQYLKKTDNPQEAENLYNDITYKKPFQMKLLAKKYPEYKEIYNCKHINRHNWVDYPASCIINNGFRLYNLKRMGDEEIKSLLNYLPDSKIKEEITIVFNKDYRNSFKNLNVFYPIFLQITPNVEIPSIYLNNIAKDRRFKYFLNLAVRSKKDKLKTSLLNIHYKEIKDRDKFLLALNAIDLKRYNLAIKILKSKKYKTNKDNFWLYLLTKNKKYANKLLDNKRLDFYTLYMYEQFNKPYKIDKVTVSNSEAPKYNINNPIDVIHFYQKKAQVKNYKKFVKQLDSNKTLPLKVLILEKINHYQKNYYIMPKYNLKDFNISQKALFYGLARQESRFIPAQISRSYAIGLMQMMPFLIRAFDPKEGMRKFFGTKTNVKYAKKHLKWLMARLKHPLFIAYAYNGGIGFTKRKVKNYFTFKGTYEPFLSMEMVPYSESREYGKKVLTNYVIYKNKLGGNTSLHKLLRK